MATNQRPGPLQSGLHRLHLLLATAHRPMHWQRRFCIRRGLALHVHGPGHRVRRVFRPRARSHGGALCALQRRGRGHSHGCWGLCAGAVHIADGHVPVQEQRGLWHDRGVGGVQRFVCDRHVRAVFQGDSHPDVVAACAGLDLLCVLPGSSCRLLRQRGRDGVVHLRLGGGHSLAYVRWVRDRDEVQLPVAGCGREVLQSLQEAQGDAGA
mmetsp:Transcript_22869/g.64961  ORF Transcript_22869/g.64961 Transcript_22869/m.64961 type:complete len:210 (+) Transcript_22869:105-734(+)